MHYKLPGCSRLRSLSPPSVRYKMNSAYISKYKSVCLQLFQSIGKDKVNIEPKVKVTSCVLSHTSQSKEGILSYCSKVLQFTNALI